MTLRPRRALPQLFRYCCVAVSKWLCVRMTEEAYEYTGHLTFQSLYPGS